MKMAALLLLGPVLLAPAQERPGASWKVEVLSATVGQILAGAEAASLVTTYYSARGLWQPSARWMVRAELEGGEEIGGRRGERMGDVLGSQWDTNELHEDEPLILGKLHLEGESADGRLNWQLGKISPKYPFDDNRAARSKRTKFLAEPFARNPAVHFAAKGLGGVLMGDFTPRWEFGLCASDANAVSTKSGLSTWRGEWFRCAELTWKPDPRAAVRALVWGTEKGGRHDDGWGLSVDWEVAPHWVAFTRAGGGSRRFAHSARAESVGVAWEKPFGHEKDYMGLGLARGRGHGTGQREERMAELFYRWQVNQVFAITPDVQFARHPTAAGMRGSTWVFGVRCAVRLR